MPLSHRNIYESLYIEYIDRINIRNEQVKINYINCRFDIIFHQQQQYIADIIYNFLCGPCCVYWLNRAYISSIHSMCCVLWPQHLIPYGCVCVHTLLGWIKSGSSRALDRIYYLVACCFSTDFLSSGQYIGVHEST